MKSGNGPVTPSSAPLTEAQEGIWRAATMAPDNPALNIARYLELLGPLNRDALAQAVAQAVAQAPALSLRFADPGNGPRQATGLPPMLGFADLSVQPDAPGQALALMRADANRPLQLDTDPAAAFTLFVLGPQRHFLYQRVHHLAVDDYGMALVTNRIATHYIALTTGGLPPPPFAALGMARSEDLAYRASPRRCQDRDWWQSRLTAMTRTDGHVPRGRGILCDSRPVPTALLDALSDRARSGRLDWADALSALCGAYLARSTGGETVVGLTFPARKDSRIADLPCTAVNVLPHHLRVDPDAPLSEWLAAQSGLMAQARSHGLYRTDGHHAARISVQPFDKPPVLTGLECHTHVLGAGAVDDLTLGFRGDLGGMMFELNADPALYTQDGIRALGDRILAFVQAALAAASLGAVPVDDARKAGPS